ncbi:MAG: hypothetical protein ACKVX9_16675 [Blastocatellia bacterium]
MPIPISPSLVLSAVSSLLRFRDQVDSILSIKEAAVGLPFLLPPAPTDEAPHLDDMIEFFRAEQGTLILHLNNLADEFEILLKNPRSLSGEIPAARKKLFLLYFEAANIRPKTIGPSETLAHPIETKGPSTGMRLAFYVVESQRLSRNPALVNLLLVTTDSLLEFAGQNANLFIANPQTRSLVESLIDEFAVKRDFEDEGIQTVFKHLLGSTLLALADHPGKTANKPVLQALFAALGTVRENLGNDFVARVVSLEGFEQLIGAFATEVAADPSFLTKNDLAKGVLTATLSRIGTDFRHLLEEPKALLGVLEVGISAATANVAGILEKKLDGGEPLLTAALTGMLREVALLSGKDQFFASFAKDQFIKDLYRASLTAIAANPRAFGKQEDVRKFTSSLIAGLAGALSQKELKSLFSADTLKLLASESLSVLSADPHFLAGNNQFAVNLLGGAFKAAATAVSDGLTKKDLVDIATVALQASTDNLALLKLDARLTGVLESVGGAIASSNLNQLLNTQGRKSLLLSSIRAVAANPAAWGKLHENELAQPLIQGILSGLSADRSGLLSGTLFINTASRLMSVLVRQKQMFIDKDVELKALQNFLTMAVHNVEDEIGGTIDAENLPRFLERAVVAFLKTPTRRTEDPAILVKRLLPPLIEDFGNVSA